MQIAVPWLTAQANLLPLQIYLSNIIFQQCYYETVQIHLEIKKQMTNEPNSFPAQDILH